ncbi:hypothetical protein LOAG_01155 [Loa loa]|uniref:Uncharacterized protein n=1 Tax=Loa loa TaxID=7209 RepID=A0A1S0U9I3_LOALO|nr:hypothetical protein LOAG_01155 [Loa loa]EFO27326.1 hypothetical protein LOAG_01155 [Loa loa]
MKMFYPYVEEHLGFSRITSYFIATAMKYVTLRSDSRISSLPEVSLTIYHHLPQNSSLFNSALNYKYSAGRIISLPHISANLSSTCFVFPIDRVIISERIELQF